MKRFFLLDSSRVVFALLVLMAGLRPALAGDGFHRQEDVVYGHKDGMALVMDVFRPEQTNGLGIIFAVSGGWFSSKAMISPGALKPFLSRGYTVFAVMHGSQPRFHIPEIIDDMKRSVRYVRLHAKNYGIDPKRLGMLGLSAGGHLSLILATQGDSGEAEAKDPINRESSEVQCVACFFPPTDFLNFGAPHTNVLTGDRLAQFLPAFGTIPTDPVARETYGKSISPIYWITTNLPPVLIFQGDADPLVPPQQANSFRDKAVAMGDTVEVVIEPGKGHGWPDLPVDLAKSADWFDRYLRPAATAK